MNLSFGFLKFDRAFQASVFIMNTSILLGAVFNYEFFVWLLYLQFFIGFYQVFISGLVNLISRSLDIRVKRLRLYHFWGGIAYVFLIFGVAPLGSDILKMVFGVAVPQIMAYAYFFLTWKDYQGRKNYREGRPMVFGY